jgi:DUF917 family protein
LGVDDVTNLGLGCAVLGAGGGGNVETGSWAARHALAEYGPVDLIGVPDLPADGLVVPMHAIGAPTVSQEMLPSGREPAAIRDEVERVLGAPVVALMPGEIGGANGVRCVGWAAALGVPLLDADGMGRAFPEIDMVSMELAGRPPRLLVISDVLGNVTTLRPVDGPWAERLARSVCVASGSTALMTSYVMPVAEVAGAVIEGSVSQALLIGSLLHDHRGLDSLCGLLSATRIVTGKISELDRVDGGGFVRGSVVVSGVGQDRGRLVRLEIQNENLLVLEDGKALATSPDLIVALDSESAHALGTDGLQFGQRVTILAWPCDEIWRSPAGIAKTGPRAFGYDLDFQPVETLGAGQARPQPSSTRAPSPEGGTE